MFVTRMKFAALAFGLLAVGAVATAQQSGRSRSGGSARPSSAATASETKPGAIPYLVNPIRGGDDVALEKEMKQLEVDLLEDEVKLLREQVNNVLKERVQYETGPTQVDPRAAGDAQNAYLVARVAYLNRARELAIARRRYGKSDATAKDDKKPKADAATAAEPKATVTSSQGPGGAMVGSVRMAEVLERYEKAREFEQRRDLARNALSLKIRKLKSEASQASDAMKRLEQAGRDHRLQQGRLQALSQQIQTENETFEKGWARSQARELAEMLREIQEVIAAIAGARGLDYVVTVDSAPRPDADPNEVFAAINRAVLYAHPRNDITEEVLRELNRRDAASAPKAPR